jgi:hypothetical protein
MTAISAAGMGRVLAIVTNIREISSLLAVEDVGAIAGLDARLRQVKYRCVVKTGVANEAHSALVDGENETPGDQLDSVVPQALFDHLQEISANASNRSVKPATEIPGRNFPVHARKTGADRGALALLSSLRRTH